MQRISLAVVDGAFDVGDLLVDDRPSQGQTADDSVEAIADTAGYRDGVMLRALLREKTGGSMRALRRRRALDSGGGEA